MTTVSQKIKLCSEIVNGDWDEYLEEISLAIRHRNDREADFVYYSVKNGDKVRFTEKARPQYLIGTTATVVSHSRRNIKITLDHSVGRFPAGREISCPPGIVEKV